MSEKIIKSSGQRVYSYVADDGTVYYSLTRKKTVVSGVKLVLQSRNGTPLLLFLVFLRNSAAALSSKLSTRK